MPFNKGGSGIDQLTGDVTAGPGTGSQAATLAAVGTAETVGDATHYPIITTDAKGRVTVATAQAVPPGVSPATTVTGPDAYGAAAVVGVGTTFARADHDHGLPAAPVVPTAATTVTGPDAYGAAAVVGVGTTFARADHDHGLPAAPSPTLTTYSGAISTAVSLPTSTWTTVLTTVSLPLGTYLLSVVIEVMPAATATAVTSLAGFIGGGTGVATFQYAGINSNISNGQPTATYSLLSATQVITVTTAGTFVIQVNPSATAADAEQCYYAAVKIA